MQGLYVLEIPKLWFSSESRLVPNFPIFPSFENNVIDSTNPWLVVKVRFLTKSLI